jgi:voltage-gated potassium channel
VLLAVYYLLPVGHRWDTHAVVILVLLLAIFGLAVTSQVRSIMTSPTPVLRAVEALGFSIPLLLLSFSMTYFLMARIGTDQFTQPLTRTDALYFSTTVFATVGFGDIAPVTASARLVVTGQMLIDLVVLGLGLRVIIEAVQISRRRTGQSPGQRNGAA